MALATGQAGRIANGTDRGIAFLVKAIRSGDKDTFTHAIRQAHADGISPAMIDAATEAFHRRNKGHR